MLLRRFTQHVRSENWFAVVLDLLVVVVGLFLGLQIDTWWEGQKEARLESAYLVEIQEDLELNRASLESSIADLEEIIRNMIVIHEQSSLSVPSLSAAVLNEKFVSIHNMPTFMPVSRAYVNLTGSGDLKLIQNRSLKNGLAEYYAAAQLTALVQSTHEMELVQTFQPYIIANLDYAAIDVVYIKEFPLPPPIEEERIMEVLGTRLFRNIVAQKWNISSDLLDQHRQMLERTNAVLQMLE